MTNSRALMAVWDEARGELDERQVEEFNDRLNREWAIETGIIERIYTLDEGTTRLLIEQGIDASLIAHDNGNGGSPELIAGIIRDHQEAVEWLFEIVRQASGPSPPPSSSNLHHLMTRKQDARRRCRHVRARRGRSPLRSRGLQEAAQQPHAPRRQGARVLPSTSTSTPRWSASIRTPRQTHRPGGAARPLGGLAAPPVHSDSSLPGRQRPRGPRPCFARPHPCRLVPAGRQP